MTPRRGLHSGNKGGGSNPAEAALKAESPVQGTQRDIDTPGLYPWKGDLNEAKDSPAKWGKRRNSSVHQFRLRARPIYRENIWVVDNFLTADECCAWRSYAETANFEETYHPASDDIAFRDNGRIERWDVGIAEIIWKRLKLFLPETVDGLHPVGCYEKIRLYRYRAGGQRFGKHIDESVEGSQTGTTTKVTVLIYLNGAESGLRGGETVFYRGAGNAEAVRFTPEPGTLLCHGYVT